MTKVVNQRKRRWKGTGRGESEIA